MKVIELGASPVSRLRSTRESRGWLRKVASTSRGPLLCRSVPHSGLSTTIARVTGIRGDGNTSGIGPRQLTLGLRAEF